MATRNPSLSDSIEGTGFDAPVSSRRDDHLNRWPLARQVYSVAVDGPADWSARIGVYGEWGTGKSSVLKFVESMALADQHVVVWFNPWAYSTKSELWRAFVMEISSKIEPKEGEGSSSGMRDWKARLGKCSDWLSGKVKEVPGDIAGGTSVALDTIRGLFAFSPKDVAAMREQFGGKRVIILIDDLDRTSAELVPEILYALKEIMDVPGFSFICGFDPKVVGDVLRLKHPGFGDGLKFLEKIIDYPVWVPSATDEGLRKIAEADSKKYCPFIPPTSLHDALDLLPKNPRSIRQFVRLCALLKTQTERHGSDELNWPIIMTANVIKVRFPMLDLGVLHSKEFYRSIAMHRTYNMSSKIGEEAYQDIGAHAEKCLNDAGVIDINGESKALLRLAISRICLHLDLWMGEGAEGVAYQSTLVEQPRALTKNEFENLVPLWKSKKSIQNIRDWMTNHTEKQGMLNREVACELVAFLVDRLKMCLRIADGAFTDRERASNRAQATRTLSFLEEIVLRPAKLQDDLKVRNWIPVDLLISHMVKLAEARSSVHMELWPKIEKMLTELVRGWDTHFNPVLDAVRSAGRYGINGRYASATVSQLNDIADDHLSYQLINGVKEPDFISSIANYRETTKMLRDLIVTPNSRLWEFHSKAFVTAFSEPRPTSSIRSNAYMLLEWIEHLLKGVDPGDDEGGKALAGNNNLMQALWKAATFKPFLGKHAHMICEIPKKVLKFGVALQAPLWWQPAIDEYLSSIQATAPNKKPKITNKKARKAKKLP